MATKENNLLDVDKFAGTGSALTNNLYGLNPTHIEEKIHGDSSFKTHVFFTRPQLNLTSANCILSNELIKLLTVTDNSIHRYTRAMLDPRLFHSEANIKSDLVDPLNPFIPALSNFVTKIGGWPDVVMATRTSKEGYLKEQTIIADGTTEIYNSFDLDMTFRNVSQEPITTIFGIWLDYMDKVHKGRIMPYMDMIMRREIDYMSRVYIITTDETSNVIKKITNTGAGFPITNPMGMFSDFDKASNTNKTPKDINIRFKCIGAEYNKHNSMLDFNALVAAFHPKMKKLHTGDANSGMMQVPESLYPLLKYRIYPYIDLATNRLLWYVDEEIVKITTATN